MMLWTLNQIIKSQHDPVGNGKHEIRKGKPLNFPHSPDIHPGVSSVSCHNAHLQQLRFVGSPKKVFEVKASTGVQTPTHSQGTTGGFWMT